MAHVPFILKCLFYDHSWRAKNWLCIFQGNKVKYELKFKNPEFFNQLKGVNINPESLVIDIMLNMHQPMNNQKPIKKKRAS